MSNEFEQSFANILRKKQAVPKKAKREKQPDLGDTTSGKAQFKPLEPVRDDAVGGGGMRVIPASHGHASKAHGGRKQVRKVGISWR